MSGPLGHTQWEPEQPFPLGFETLDSDNAGVPCQNKSEQTGLDFRNGDQNNISQQTQKEKDLVDNHLNVSNLSFGDLQFEGDHTTISQTFLHSTHIKDLSCTEKTEGLDEISDCTLSWLFSPNFADVIGKNSAQKELSPPEDSPLEDLEVLSSQVALITLSVPSSSVKTDTGDPFLLVDLSNEHPAPNSESSGELNPQGVSEELVKVPCKEQVDLPPLQSRETLSPEIGDKGLFPDQVTDLPVTSSATLQGLPENCLLHNTHSTPLECFEGSVPLLDLDVPDFDSSLSLWPASAASVIYTGTPLDVSSEESEVVHEEAAVIRNLTLEQQGENDLLALGLLNEPSSLTLPLVEDALIQGDLSSQSSSVENTPKDLMEDKICSEVKNQGNEAMALDPCLTVEEVHDDESWDLKPQEGVRNENSPAAEERPADTTQLQGSGCDEVASFDFSVQDLNTTSSEPEWTSEQAVETISLSNMVVDDSLPMVSAVSAGEEDVSPLKAVFDALDQDGDGFVRIEEFMEFAAAYGADQVRSLVFCFFFFRFFFNFFFSLAIFEQAASLYRMLGKIQCNTINGSICVKSLVLIFSRNLECFL